MTALKSTIDTTSPEFHANEAAMRALTAELQERRAKTAEGELPSDMSTMSLIGGGLIAGDALAALAIGVYGILQAMG